MVRTEKSAKRLVKETLCKLDQLIARDITKIKHDGIPKKLENAEAMVICTSAVPVLNKFSALKALLQVPINVCQGKKAFNFRDLTFHYKPGQFPEFVDYEGQKNQIDLAKKLGVKHIILVSSLGGTDPGNFFNTIGKKKDGTGNGDILLWKRKAEKYLVDSGLAYTIIHPGGLRDTPGGKEQLILDVNDKFLENKKRSISRSDVANLCVAALTVGKGRKLSFDCIAREAKKGERVKTAEEALTEFLDTGLHTDYSL